MSDADRDRAVMEAAGVDPDDLSISGDEIEGGGEYVRKADFLAFADRVCERLDDLEVRLDDTQPVEPDGPPIVQYANIPADERAELLDTSEQIAVTLHVNWRDIAWDLGGGGSIHGTSLTADGRLEREASQQKVGVDTKAKAAAKYNPSRLKHRLKQRLDRDLQANEVYRGLKRLAKLSGGEEHVDDATGRVRITGGLYEYRERATADNMDVRRVLWRAADG